MLTEDKAIERQGHLYCSIDCADGRGCNHSNCGCRKPSDATKSRYSPGDDNTDKQSATKPANRNNPTKPAASQNPGHRTDFNPSQGSPSIRSNPEAGRRD
jgi:hypothetical protein